MRKLILLFSLLVISLSLKAQNPIVYSSVIKIDSIDAKQLYEASKQWFITSFPSPKKVIQVDDPNMKFITGRGTVEFSMNKLGYIAYDGFLEYSVQIQAKDGRIKVDIINITHTNLPERAPTCSLGVVLDSEKQFQGGLSSGAHNKVIANIKDKMNVYSLELFTSIEDFIKKYQSKEAQNW